MMGWFSKAIPERKWGDVSTTLGLSLRKERDSWYSTVQHSSASYGFLFVSDNISHTAIHCTSMLQLSAVAATLEENSYVSDLTFFLELVYIVLTENPPADLHRDIESSPFSRAGPCLVATARCGWN